MREATCKLRQKAHIGKRFGNLCLALFFGEVLLHVHQAFGNDIVHLCALVERCHRILEDHLDLLRDALVQLVRNFSVDFFSFEDNLARGGGVDADDRAANGGLA